MDWQMLLLGIIIGYCLFGVLREALKLHKRANQKRDQYAAIIRFNDGRVKKVPFEEEKE